MKINEFHILFERLAPLDCDPPLEQSKSCPEPYDFEPLGHHFGRPKNILQLLNCDPPIGGTKKLSRII